jgi:prepilin peptidase CpaA
LLLSGLIYHGFVGGSVGLGASLLGMLFGFGILLLLYALGGMGAGDVKFMAAIGAWLGMPVTAIVFLAASLAAGLYSLVLLLAFGNIGETWVNLQIVCHRIRVFGRHLGAEDRIETELHRRDYRRRLIPFTAMVAVGMFAVLTLAWMSARP